MTLDIPPAFLIAATLVVMAGCSSMKHDVSKPEAGTVSVCSQCYDQIRKARSTGGPRGGLATNRTITTHMCVDCKAEMSVFEKDGVLMVRCPSCAPEGVPCDRCSPKDPSK